MEAVGYLRDAQLGGLQQERSLHQQHLVDIIDNGAARNLTDHAGEIDGRDMELTGVKRDIVVLYKVAGQNTDEADEDFFHALRRLALYDGTLLGVLQVEQEDGIEHAQYLVFVNMLGLKTIDDFTHLREQMQCGIRRQRLFRLMQLYDRQIGQMNKVVDGWRLDGEVLIGHQAVAVEIVGSGDDVDWKAWRISVQVALVQRQIASIVVNRQPSFVNQHKGEAGNESPQQVGTKDFRSISFQAVHPVTPAFFGQVITYKYWQIFFQRVHTGYKDTNFSLTVSFQTIIVLFQNTFCMYIIE